MNPNKPLASLFFSVFFILQISSLLAQNLRPEWKWMKPKTTGNNLWESDFVNEFEGWAVGNFGAILKTANGGQSWFLQEFPTTDTLLGVDFVSSQLGWVCGSNGLIYKTTNGGQTWFALHSGSTERLTTIHFTSPNVGIAIGWNSTILRTTNGGVSWSMVNASIFENTRLRSLFFLNAQVGWLVGNNSTMMKTTDGGQTWNPVPLLSLQQSLFSCFWLDEQTGWTGNGSGALHKTTNGGQTWSVVFDHNQEFYSISKIHFFDSNHGLLQESDFLIASNNAFVNQLTYSQNVITYFFSPISNQKVVSLSHGTNIQLSTDQGVTWSESVVADTCFKSLSFASQTHWYGTNNYGVYKSTNSGENWNLSHSTPSGTYNDVKMLDSLNGWFASHSSLCKTTNGGSSWNYVQVGFSINLRFYFPLNMNQIWAVSGNNNLRYSSNGGQTFTLLSTTCSLSSFYFLNDQLGWGVGFGGLVQKTTNGGQTWTNVSIGATGDLQSIKFIDANRGWILGQNKLYRTTNGGLTWQVFDGNFDDYYSDFNFKPNGEGWISIRGSWETFGQRCLYSTDGGASFTTTVVPCEDELAYVKILNDSTTILGGPGSILVNKPIPTNSVVKGRVMTNPGVNCDSTNQTIWEEGRVIKLVPGPYYTLSDEKGRYTMLVPSPLDTTSFTLTKVTSGMPGYMTTEVCPASGSYTFNLNPEPDTLLNQNFGTIYTPCHQMEVEISSLFRRPCRPNFTRIAYKNIGLLPANNAYVEVTYPRFVRPVSSLSSFEVVSDSVWRFPLGTVTPGQQGIIAISDTVSCEALPFMNLTQCISATIYPPQDCPPPSNWSGAEVKVKGICEDGLVKLGIFNSTSVSMPDSVDYWIFMDSLLVKQGKVKLAAGDSIQFSVIPFNTTVHLSVNQVAFHPTELFTTATVEACEDGTILLPRTTLNHFSTPVKVNKKSHCLPISLAYDPNDKQVFPIGFTANRVVPPNTRLEYLIRFQNTGNDTAFTVFLVDTLDANLNPETFDMGVASHTCKTTMSTIRGGKTMIRWQFDNILLPDSNVNEPKSHGFVQFRISPKPDLPLGIKVRNKADIFFDFNPPITTNETLNTFDNLLLTDSTLSGNVTVITSVGPQVKNFNVRLFPNPLTGNSLQVVFDEPGSLTLFDGVGRVVFEKANLNGHQILPIQVKPGFYMAETKTSSGTQIHRLVVY